MAVPIQRLGEPRGSLIGSSLVIFTGFTLARLLGFAFTATAARSLTTPDFGLLSYTLGVAALAALLATGAPLGLAGFLARHQEDPGLRQSWYSNWLAAVALIAAASAALSLLVAPRFGVGGWLVAGVVANIAGVAVLETYREVQRGLTRYVLAAVFYVAANLLQLLAVLAAAHLGFASPQLFMVVYGVSPLAALLLVRRAAASRLRFSAWLVSGERVREILRFVRPVLLQSVFFNVWFAADLILVERLAGDAAAGRYAAAKTLAYALFLAPAAIGFVLLPRVARLEASALPRHLLQALGLAAAVTLPAVALLMLWGAPALGIVFSDRYQAAAAPLAILAAGMAVYGLCSVLGNLWLGLGRPTVDTVATALAMLTTIVAALVLVPRRGVTGGAWAFDAGAAVRLFTMGAWTAAAIRAGGLRRRLPATEGPAWATAASGERAVAVLADEVTGPSDEGYVKSVRELLAALGRRRPTVDLLLGEPRPRSRPVRALLRVTRVLAVAGSLRPHQHRLSAAVYVSRAGCTLPALARARLLRLRLRRTPVVLAALQPRCLDGWRSRLLGLLRPQLILASTAAERDRLRALGLRAETVWGGVDVTRFRPAAEGEKATLRTRWGLPEETRLVLHVGHLHEGRNLEALAPLAARPGISVLVVASTRLEPQSDVLERRLARQGLIVLGGFQENIDEVYRLADCYVFPTTSTDSAISTPLSVIEALASDLPVASTRLGALPELFGAEPGVRFVDRPEELPAAVLAQLEARPATRHLAQRFSWDVQAERLLGLIEDRGLRQWRPAPAAAVLLARAWRALWALEDGFRRRRWGPHPGFELRPTPPETVELLQVPADAPGAGSWPATEPTPATARVGVVAEGELPGPTSAALAGAGFYGLEAMVAAIGASDALWRRAAEEGWPLVVLGLRDGSRLEPAHAERLRTFVEGGGTALVTTEGIASNPGLARLGSWLGLVKPPASRALRSASTGVYFAAEARWLVAEFAGVQVETAEPTHHLEVAAGAEVLAWTLSATGRSPALVQYRRGDGRVIFSSASDRLGGPLHERLGARWALSVLPPLMLMRRLYGERAWHPPARLANFTVDDPLLRRGKLGLDYPRALERARECGFHLTVATVPRDLRLADPAVVHLLTQEPLRLSACYHGCDHSGYEFYFPNSRGLRHRARSAVSQRGAIERAARRGRAFSARSGLALDRVMVFPYGVGATESLPALARAGFLASSNLDDRDPLGAPRPRDPWLRLRPADTAWGALPLLWRRRLGDHRTLFDLFMGRPALMFAHPRALGPDFEALAGRAREIDRLSQGRVRWRGLEEIAHHAYLVRQDGAGGWQALMTGNQICLHNPSQQPRQVTVERPHRPPQSALATGEGEPSASDRVPVLVPARGTRQVSLLSGSRSLLPEAARPCSLFETGPGAG